ncbi:hypothetical protein E2C01_045922 [Portunus trituberculatus]|uniref:Uncharacterized protein n=1 Tax=Portunus trituberculatus TaxID=210409 RepID=A0A5B7FZJ3_PORTR|nr:hypothetical protein [Portunus trituberculatus]
MSVRDNLSDSQESMLEKQHRRSTPREIGIGDVVFHRVHDRHSKLDPLFNGSHRVMELMHDHKVKILELKTGKEGIVHRDHLKRVDLGFDTDTTTPLTLPRQGSVSIDSWPVSPPPLQFPITFGLAQHSSAGSGQPITEVMTQRLLRSGRLTFTSSHSHSLTVHASVRTYHHIYHQQGKAWVLGYLCCVCFFNRCINFLVCFCLPSS